VLDNAPRIATGAQHVGAPGTAVRHSLPAREAIRDADQNRHYGAARAWGYDRHPRSRDRGKAISLTPLRIALPLFIEAAVLTPALRRGGAGRRRATSSSPPG